MKVRYTDDYLKRAGQKADLLPAAAQRMIERGLAEPIDGKAKTDDASKPAPAKKTAAKKTTTSKTD